MSESTNPKVPGPSSVTQEGNQVGGDQAGRDIFKTTFVLPTGRGSSVEHMRKLAERYKNERRDNAIFNGILEELQHFKQPVEGEKIIGLEEKLKLAKLDCLIPFAVTTKELFAKKLSRNFSSECAQEIFSVLLAEVWTRFQLNITPLLQKMDSVEIPPKVYEIVVGPVNEMLGENVLELKANDVAGMVYFLTGNCHITWVP